MKLIRAGLAAILAVGLSACATTDTDTRNGAATTSGGKTTAPITRPAVTKLRVLVPETLEVSEAGSLYPKADIVWRGDPPGDRYAQIKAIFEEGMGRGVADMKSGPPVIVDIVVLRFHALTERARYTVGGVHSIKFTIALRDATTGEIIAPPRKVKADLPAFGGDKAIEAERAGQTQKVRISDHLARVIRQELGYPPLPEADPETPDES